MQRFKRQWDQDKGRAIVDAPKSPPLKTLTKAQLSLFSYGDNRKAALHLNVTAEEMDKLLAGRRLDCLSDKECHKIERKLVRMWKKRQKATQSLSANDA